MQRMINDALDLFRSLHLQQTPFRVVLQLFSITLQTIVLHVRPHEWSWVVIVSAVVLVSDLGTLERASSFSMF